MPKPLINKMETNKKVDPFLIQEKVSVKEAMRQMGRVGEKILFVVDSQKRLIGSLSDGDIRRWFLKRGTLDETIKKVYHRKPTYFDENYDLNVIKELMVSKKLPWIPVVDKDKRISDILLWEGVFGKEVVIPRHLIKLPVVIMAGGKGTRLDPFTRILPKPLIPIGEKTILEIIMDKFQAQGANDFYISVHYKSRMIKAYFDEIKSSYKIHYLDETMPLGTAGGLKSLQHKIKGDVIVSNCDILIDTDYSDIAKFHKTKKYDITMVGSFRHFTIPYGVCMIENGGQLVHIKEKPEYVYLVNTGMYVLKSKVLELIPKGKHFNITDLIEKVKAVGGKVGVFPIDEKSWIDIGQWEEYQKSVQGMNLSRTTL